RNAKCIQQQHSFRFVNMLRALAAPNREVERRVTSRTLTDRERMIAEQASAACMEAVELRDLEPSKEPCGGSHALHLPEAPLPIPPPGFVVEHSDGN
ncbi:MAG: hypothetical protein ACJ8HQ_06445, partial [Chthoniobacterales bacterium]